MDPLTQGLLGATCAQGLLPAAAARRAWLAGLAGGLLPDADVLLEPLADPALPWEYHRHFTHAFVMAPVMGLLAGGLLVLLIPWFRRHKAITLGGAVLGAVTHAPLDWMTSYGTRVLWPFSSHGWTSDLYPIVDPLFTLVLLVCVLWGAIRKTRRPIAAAAVFLALYTGVAIHQQGQIRDAQQALIAARGHTATRARVMPLPGSLLVWRSLYETPAGDFVADVLRVTPLAGADATEYVPGGSLRKTTVTGVAAEADDPDRVREVLPRFAAFADQWIAWVPNRAGPRRVGDMRFVQGAGFEALWGLEIDPPDGPAVRWSMAGMDGRRVGDLWDLLLGRHADLRPVPHPEGRK